MNTDHLARSRDTRAAQAFPRESREVRVHWLLCADGTGAWIEREGSGDNSHMESERQDIHRSFSALNRFEMVDWLPWTDGQSCSRHGTIDYRGEKLWTSSVRGPSQRLEDS